MEDTIIVVGRRPLEPVSNFNLSPFLYLPVVFTTVDWITGNEGFPEPFSVTILEENGRRVFKFEGIDTVVAITDEDWNQLTPDQKNALNHILSNIALSPTLTAAFQHYHSQEINEIRIMVDTSHVRQDGTPIPIPNGTAAATNHVHMTGDYNDLAPNTNIHITINPNVTQDLHTISEMFIHEILHPWVPNITHPDNLFTDEPHPNYPGFYPDNVVARTQQAITEMMPTGTNRPGHSIENVAQTVIGAAFMGSFSGDQFVGTAGNDVIAGMGGNDYLDGGSGSDVIAGGAGLDILRAGQGESQLIGGSDADTYELTQFGTSVQIEDSQGVDRVEIPFAWGDTFVYRHGDDLEIIAGDASYRVYIRNQFVDTNRIEVFEFSNYTYSASFVERWAETPPDQGCYDEQGTPIPCGGGYGYLAPVILDLLGDGLKLVDAEKSKVRFDVDGDGSKEQVGWFKGPDDMMLVFDRNGNGRVDGPSEISFLADMLGAASDLEGLLAFDSDRDGALTASDAVFSSLMVWNDRNHNGVSDRGELNSLVDVGIEQISLEIFDRSSLDPSLEVNQVLGRSNVVFTDGRVSAAYDVALDSDPVVSSCGCGSLGGIEPWQVVP